MCGGLGFAATVWTERPTGRDLVRLLETHFLFREVPRQLLGSRAYEPGDWLALAPACLVAGCVDMYLSHQHKASITCTLGTLPFGAWRPTGAWVGT